MTCTLFCRACTIFRLGHYLQRMPHVRPIAGVASARASATFSTTGGLDLECVSAAGAAAQTKSVSTKSTTTKPHALTRQRALLLSSPPAQPEEARRRVPLRRRGLCRLLPKAARSDADTGTRGCRGAIDLGCLLTSRKALPCQILQTQ